MASDYYPIYSTLWGDEKLERAPFEERGFFAYLCSNNRQRPSGIFRVTDAQLAADTTLALTKVRAYCADLDRRGLIVRDGAWLFVRAYFKRQPKGENLLKGVAADIATCSSFRVLESFAVKYPLRSQWVSDRLATLERPINDSCSTVQCSAVAVLNLQSSAEQGDAPTVAAPLTTPTNGSFSIPKQILHALERAPRLGAVAPLRAPAFWQAELRANPGVELDRELLKAEAYLVAHPEKHYRKLGNFLHGWFGRADRPPEGR